MAGSRLRGTTNGAVPSVRLSHLNAAQRRAYVIADNKLALNAGWDHEMLAIELQALIDLDFDVEITGFSLAEVDLVLDEAQESSTCVPDEPEDEMPPLTDPAAATTALAISGCWVAIVCFAGIPGIERVSKPCSGKSGATSSSPIHLITYRSKGTSAGWAGSDTGNSPWASAKCRGGFHRFSETNPGPCGKSLPGRRHRLRLYGLASPRRIARGR